MKFLFSLISQMFFTGVISAQVITSVNWTEQTKMNATETIYYNINKKLVWADFKGMPAAPSPVAAITSSGFGYRADMKTLNGKGQINISVYCYFSKLKSWVRIKNKTAYILEHEQHHFDATYFAAMAFMQKIKATKITVENMDAVLGALYKEANSNMNNMQNDYDSQTKNGILKEKQEEWNDFFKNKLTAQIKIN
jgi:hypothetical protein